MMLWPLICHINIGGPLKVKLARSATGRRLYLSFFKDHFPEDTSTGAVLEAADVSNFSIAASLGNITVNPSKREMNVYTNAK